ncbi:MAG TPA: restriction endonuclease [Rhodocyclaceae bacterium]|nr:restriction endonuclease [Rhodocyclaceae bacterium]
MARKRKTSTFEDLFEIAAALPWWAGVLLALIVYPVIHHFAVVDVPITTSPGQMGQVVVWQMTKAIATYCQYIIPLLFLAGAVASFFGRRKREGLLTDVATGRSGDALRNMSWREFEMLVGEAFRMNGYSVTETGGGGADGGIDLELRKGGETFLVQCKQWRAFKVSVNIVRELFGVMAAQGATGGFVVTSGVFTADAQDFAKGRNIDLIDGAALKVMIERARATRSAAAPASSAATHAYIPAPVQASEPACPRCGGAMVKRIAKQGSNAGGSFWGCSGYPACRGILAID